MDRSVASTLAFAAAERAEANAVWPSDVPRPDLLVLLTLDEVERTRRLAGRSGPTTDEERRLASDPAFRARVLEAYRSLGAIALDASGSIVQIVAAIEALLSRPT